MNEDKNEQEVSVVIPFNVNLGKVNLWMIVVCVVLSLFMNEYEFLRTIYNCLITILIYNNAIFIYLMFSKIKRTWKN